MITVLSFLLAIAILVFVHEMGHYLAARQCHVEVERFSIGFGRDLLKWTSKTSGTEWVISLIPLGGYVRMKDASFESKPLAARAWIVFAGPLANLIFAALAYAALFSTGREEPQSLLAEPPAQTAAALAGVQALDRVVAVNGRSVHSYTDLRWRVAQSMIGGGSALNLKVRRDESELDIALTISAQAADDMSRSMDPVSALSGLGLLPYSDAVRVLRIQEGSAAEQAGLRVGDLVVAVNGEAVQQPDRMIGQIQGSRGVPVALIVKMAEGFERVTVTPKVGVDGAFRIGAVVGANVATTRVSDDPLTAIQKGVIRTWEMTALTFRALGRMVLGELSWRQISGPVSIADAAGKSAAGGLKEFLGFLGLISISIAALNLLPIPMLDGGHLLYYAWELMRGKPLSVEVQEAGRRIGVALILMLTVVALFNDFSAHMPGW